MRKADLESAPLRHGALNRLKQVVVQVDTSAARTTDDVVVVSTFRVMVDEMVAQPCAIDTAKVFQKLQRAIDSGLVHALHAGLDIVDYLIRREVSIRLVDDIKNHPALWRQSKTILLEGVSAAHALCNQLRL